MMKRTSRPLFSIPITASLLACGDGETDTTPTPPEPDASVSWSACIRDQATLEYKPGVVAAVVDRPEIASVVSGDDGCFELGGLPIGERLLVTWSLDGYMPLMRTVVSGLEPIDWERRGGWLSAPGDVEALAAARAISAVDWTKGIVVVTVRDADSGAAWNMPGGTKHGATITPDLPAGSYEPCYHPNTGGGECLAETDSQGVMSIYNVEPGVIEVALGPPGVECFAEMDNGWSIGWMANGKTSTMQIPVRAGTLTSVRAYCGG